MLKKDKNIALGKQKDGQTYKHTDRQRDRQTVRQTDRQEKIDRQTDRQDRHSQLLLKSQNEITMS